VAQYNREILVPYLDNLRALELLRTRTRTLWSRAYEEIERLESSVACDVEAGTEGLSARARNSTKEAALFSTVTLGALALLVDSWCSLSATAVIGTWDFLVTIPCLIISFFVTPVCAVYAVRNLRQMFELRGALNARREACANKERRSVARRDARVPQLRERIALYEAKLKKLDALIERGYAADVVPSHCRNVYAAWYLAERVASNSGTNDVDDVLWTFSFESAKMQLDATISQQEARVVGVQVPRARQAVALKGEDGLRREALDRVARTGATGEERERYLAMEKFGVNATLWMAKQADYLV
jgi:hypothetical protein